jgi:hypothetical protein
LRRLFAPSAEPAAVAAEEPELPPVEPEAPAPEPVAVVEKDGDDGPQAGAFAALEEHAATPESQPAKPRSRWFWRRSGTAASAQDELLVSRPVDEQPTVEAEAEPEPQAADTATAREQAVLLPDDDGGPLTGAFAALEEHARVTERPRDLPLERRRRGLSLRRTGRRRGPRVEEPF